MVTFVETPRFPDDIAYGSRGGPMYNTSVFTGSSGLEKRNINWTYPRHQYNVGYGARSQEKIYDLIEFFHSTRGSGIGFRYKDFGDYKSCKITLDPALDDQPVAVIEGTGDTQFQMVKQYQIGSLIQNRLIQKPVEETIKVSVGGVLRTEGSDYTLDYSTGIITFTSAQLPSQVRWGGEFDVPCRFEDDALPVAYNDFEHGTADVNILEIMIDGDLMVLPECEGVSDYPVAKIVLETGQSLAIPVDFQYLVYRQFTVEDGATLQVDGELIVIGEDDI